jgi:hypothetical protein
VELQKKGWVNFINTRKCEIIKELAERDILSDNIINEINEFLLSDLLGN